jgi:tetratricopeptide (TPR) repeat protein
MTAALTLLAIVLTGCGPTKQEIRANVGVEAYFAGDFRAAVHKLEPLAEKTDENFVLNNCRLGSAALAEYDLPTAEAAFLRAYEVINSVGVNEGGRSIGAALVDEKIKIWKGEPYERAMVNFYLGLIYYMRHDYNNARAAFENALFKLRDYGEGKNKKDEYRRVESNFALACIMLGRCWQRLGQDDKARPYFERAVSLHGWLAPLADERTNYESNVLLVVDFGKGPRKFADFDGSVVGLAPTPAQAGPIPLPSVTVDGRVPSLEGLNRPPVDLLALAQDRRWQSIDTIRTVKSVAGEGLIAAGAIDAANDYHHHHLGTDLALIGAGALLKMSSNPDLRQWEFLPRTVFVIPLKLPPGRHDITVRFQSIPGMSQSWRDLVAPEPGGVEMTYYFHMQQYNAGPFFWPPPALAGSRDPALGDVSEAAGGNETARPGPASERPRRDE